MNNTVQNQEKPLVLVYYRVRGKLQPIRNLIYYLGLKFIEVHLEDKEEEKKKLPSDVLLSLKGVRIQKSQLPLLVYEGHYIYEIYPIMAFLCRRFEHQQLLGRNIRQKSRLQQILDIFLSRHSNSMVEMFRLGEFSVNRGKDEIWKMKKQYYERFMKESNYILEICEYLLLLGDNGGSFVLGEITLVDFLFIETCHYMLGMFNNLDEKVRCHLTKLIKYFAGECSATIEHIEHLDTMRNYLEHIQNQSFYANNKLALESISIISPCPSFTPDRVKGLRSIWLMNPKFVE